MLSTAVVISTLRVKESVNSYASVAQWDARPTDYQEVAGLTPAGSATFFNGD